MPTVALFLPHLDVSGGLGVHCRMLLTALNRTPSPHRFDVLAPARPRDLFPTTEPEPFDTATVNPSRFAFHRLDIPAGLSLARPLDPILAPPLAALKPDLLYCSYYTGMRCPPARQIVCFHDAGFLENPAGFGETAAIRKATVDAIRPAIARIQCISADARDRICRHLPWDPQQTTVVWHALPDAPEEIALAQSSSPEQFRIGETSFSHWQPYFFSPVGAATGFNRARKNVPTAVRAFRMLPDGTARFLIAGTAPLKPNVLVELLPPGEAGQIIGGRWHSEDNSIVILPTIARMDLLVAMKHAAAVVYPSRYEGFGLPTLEAMALGVPLIAGRATSIPEIVGNAGLLVDPDDVAGFSAAMQSALTDGSGMAALVHKGRERIRQFTLERLGRDMIALFESQ